MGEAFTSVSKFRVQLVNNDGSSDRVIVQIGLDGFKILDANSNRTMRSLELGHISRWQCRGRSLVLYTKTPVDVEERQLTLEGDDTTIRNALDTLTCSCMQLAELLQSKQTEVAQETASSLHALVAGGGKKKSKLPTADEVEYWRSPEKAGWLQSQGEHLKSWRKRWFVLKQGFLFRFMNDKVTESVKPRGVVDLSKVQDVKPGSSVTNKPNSIQLKTASGGSVCYVAESETECVEWMSALEGAVQRICRHAAGMEDEPAPLPARAAAPASKASAGGSKPGGGVAGGNASEWMKQLERTMESFEKTSVGGKSGGRNERDRDYDRGGYGGEHRDVGRGSGGGPAMVNVIGYETLGDAGRSGGGGGGGGGSRPAYGSSSSAQHSSSISYGQIAGAQAVVSNDTMLNYGASSVASDPYLTRSGSQHQAQPSSSIYAAYAAPQQQQQYGAPQQQQQQYGSAVQQGGSGGYYGSGTAAPGSGYGQQQAGMSLIDQVPHQQPTYPYFQQQAAAAAPAVAQAPPVSSWQVHYTGEGRPYYHNPATGSTQWEMPVGFAA